VLASGDLVGLEALGADVDLLRRTLNQDRHALDIRVDHPVRYAVRVADVAASRRLLAANGANLGHCPGSCRVSVASLDMNEALVAIKRTDDSMVPWYQQGARAVL